MNQTVTFEGSNVSGVTNVTVCGITATIVNTTDNSIILTTGACGTGQLGIIFYIISIWRCDCYKCILLHTILLFCHQCKPVSGFIIGGSNCDIGEGCTGIPSGGSYMYGTVTVTPGETLGIVCGGGTVGGYSALFHSIVNRNDYAVLDGNRKLTINILYCIAILAGGGGWIPKWW